MKPILVAALVTGIAQAQVYTPPAGGGGGQAQPANSGGDTTIVRKPQDKPAASPFGNEVPLLDPSAETVGFNGKNWAITDNRLFAARFERYLNEPEDDSVAANDYRKAIDAILEFISPHHPGGANMYEAFKLLPRASNYPGDAKLCDSLSQAMYSAMLSKQNVDGMKQMNEAMDLEKKRLIKDSDWKAAHESDPTLGETKSTGKGGGSGGNKGGARQPATNPGRGVVSLEYVDSVKRIAEIEAMKKLNVAKGEGQIFQAKVQYQALMVQFFMQRRFQHVIMAARFYNQIWRDGESKLQMDKNSDMSKLFTEGAGMSPTVNSLDAAASEAVRDCEKGVEAFNFLADKGELESASKRLSEAYAVGEYMPAVRTLPRDRKRKVLEFVRQSYKLLAAIDTKDYTNAKDYIAKLKTMAADFDPTRAEAAIAAYTRVSDMHIMSAKNHLVSGDKEKAGEEIKQAMEVWPQNPKLAEFDRVVEAGGTLAQARNDFDRLFSEANYRQIFKEQYRLAPAIQGDAKREEAFKQIITNLTTIEGAIGKANEFSKMGQDYAAWEQLAEIREKFNDDQKLGREIELLAPKVADFTKALDRAHQFEKGTPKQTGSALAWYLKARSIYPRSTFAESGIQRLLDDIIPDETRAPATQQTNNSDPSLPRPAPAAAPAADAPQPHY